MIKDTQEDRGNVIDLREPEGNAFAIMAMGQQLCNQLSEVNPEKYNWPEIQNQMMKSDYRYLVETFEYYFGDFVTIYSGDVLKDYPKTERKWHGYEGD